MSSKNTCQETFLVSMGIEEFQPKKMKKPNSEIIVSSTEYDNTEIEEFLESTIECTEEEDLIEEELSYKEKLDKILDNQSYIINAIHNLDARVAGLEYEVQLSKNGDNNVRECKEILKRVHHSVCRITGEHEDYDHIALASMLPLSSMDAVLELEEKLKIKDNIILLKSFVFKTKGNNGTIDQVMRQLFTDELIYSFNYDGKFNRKVLKDLSIIENVLYDAFSSMGRCEFEKGMKKFIELSHNRLKSKKNRRKKM